MPRHAKNFLLNTRLQGQQIGYSITSFAIGCLSMGAAVFVAYLIFISRATEQKTFLELQLINFFLSIGFPVILGVCAVLGAFLIIPFALITSHKIAGPIVALRRYIHALRAGNYSATINLRDGDDLQDLANELKQLCYELRARKDEAASLARKSDEKSALEKTA